MTTQATETAFIDKALKVADVRRIMGVGKTTAYEWINSGELESFVLGGIRRITPDSLKRFMEKHTHRKGQVLNLR